MSPVNFDSVLGTAAVGLSFAGVKIGMNTAGKAVGVEELDNVLIPGVKESLAISAGMINPFKGWKEGKIYHHGLYGFRTLIGGVDAAVEGGLRGARFTPARAALGTVEQAAKFIGKHFEIDKNNELYTRLLHAKKYGLYGMLRPKEATRLDKIIKTLAGADPAKGPITKIGSASFSAGKLTGGALRTTSLLAWSTLAFKAGTALARIGASSVTESFIRLAQTQSHLVPGANIDLAASFETQGAVTERQRAIREIYGSKVNPAGRMYGNEARYYHGM